MRKHSPHFISILEYLESYVFNKFATPGLLMNCGWQDHWCIARRTWKLLEAIVTRATALWNMFQVWIAIADQWCLKASSAVQAFEPSIMMPTNGRHFTHSHQVGAESYQPSVKCDRHHWPRSRLPKARQAVSGCQIRGSLLYCIYTERYTPGKLRVSMMPRSKLA